MAGTCSSFGKESKGRWGHGREAREAAAQKRQAMYQMAAKERFQAVARGRGGAGRRKGSGKLHIEHTPQAVVGSECGLQQTLQCNLVSKQA